MKQPLLNRLVVITAATVWSKITVLAQLLPAIVAQPASQGIVAGANATLSVTATGTPPLFYSWYFSVTNLVQSGENALLLLTNITSADAGQYSVVVTNTYGTATS